MKTTARSLLTLLMAAALLGSVLLALLLPIAKARDYLRLSGYTDFEKSVTLTTPYAEGLATGHTFSPKRMSRRCPTRPRQY